MALTVNGNTHLIPAYYSFIDPERMTCSGWFTYISGHPSAAGRAQDRESSPVRDRRSTTVLCHQPQHYVGLDISADGALFRTILSNRSHVTSAGWQVTLCDPMWHVSSRSGVAILRTAIHLLLTYSLTYMSFTRICMSAQK